VSASCVFCAIAAGQIPARIVHADDELVALLDTRPLLPGHVLVVPRAHHETLDDLPRSLIGPLFAAVMRISIAVQAAMPADGSFVAVNTRVSQSVPHVHVHVVPRRNNDGLFSPKLVWRRRAYPSDAEADAVADRIRAALAPLRPS
jgi:histidine triad (HIT) family protein